MKQAFENRTVDLNHVRQNSIVLLDLDQPLSETVFQQEYQMASHLIDKVIQRNQDRNAVSSDQTDIGSYGYTDLQTAIPFIGDRGTGKTSMMISVWNWLKRYASSEQKELFKLTGNPQFICLEMIDAGKLQGSEDILEIILSRLLSYLQEHNQDCTGRRPDYRELYKKIDFLYKDLVRIHWSDGPKIEEAGLLQLQAIADSQKASEQFRELIQDFVKTVGGDKTFLVIALDDIDMYQGSRRNGLQNDLKNGAQNSSNDKFILLEQIYNYLRAPNLILLLTYNETILRRICMGHFSQLYQDSEMVEEDRSVAKMDVEVLTRQYLTKLFPHEQRVYLPDFMRIASMNQVNLYINPKINGKIIPPFDKENQDTGLVPAPVNIKEFMLRLIAYRTGVYYDIKGNKKHFFEPRNLRELGSMIQVFDEMKEIPGKEDPEYKEKQEQAWAQNRQTLLNYLYNQFSEDHLNREEYYAFSQLCMLPVFRQNREFIDDVRRRYGYAKPESQTKPKERRSTYSYGEMLQHIYHSTRNENGPACFRKEYIHCLLGTHSVILNQTAQIQESQDEWMKLIGSSIAGSWANNMLPETINVPEDQYGRETETSGVGSLHLPASTFFELRLPSKFYHALFYMAGFKNTNCEDAGEIVCSFIEAMVLLGMFFTGFPKNGLQLKLHIGMTKGKDPALKVTVKAGSSEYLCFNALNFVINSYLSTHAHSSCTVDGKNATYLEYIKKQLEDLGDSIAKLVSNQGAFYFKQIKDAQDTQICLSKQIEEAKEQRFSRMDSWQKQMEEEKEKEQAAKQILEKFFDKNENDIKEGIEKFRQEEGNSETNNTPQQDLLNCWKYCLDKVVGKLESGKDSRKCKNLTKKWKKRAFSEETSDWKEKYGKKVFVFPIQQFDMSYNILKRLAHPDYYDREIPTDTGLSEAYDYFVSLYQSIGNQLGEQDQVYRLNKGRSFAEAYRNSVFYQRFVALANPKPSQSTGQGQPRTDGSEVSCMRILFTEMLEQAIQGKATRENVISGISGPGTLL